MTGLVHFGFDEVSSPTDRRSRRHRSEPTWRWQRRAGAGTRFRLHSRVERAAGESDATIRAREHLDYLKRMAAEGVVPPMLATKAKTVWWIAQASVDKDLPVPTASAFSGGPVEYHWSIGPHQLLAEIPTDGPCHWTYQNSNTGELWGREAAVEEELPPQLIRALIRIAASSP